MTGLPHPVVSQWLAELDRQRKSQLTWASYRHSPWPAGQDGVAHFARWSEQSYGQEAMTPEQRDA